MGEFTNSSEKSGFHLKLWRGERTTLIGMDVDQPEDDFVGFAIEAKCPGDKSFNPLLNRLAFSYPQEVSKAVTGFKNYSSLEAPFQKFRWLHFPSDGKPGTYSYRVTRMHMPRDNQLTQGDALTLDIDLIPIIYQGFLDVGFTKNFASSQAYQQRYSGNPNIIPGDGEDPLTFKKVPGDVYEWLGYEAYELIFNFLNEIKNDKSLSLDILAYDLNEPDIVAVLKALGPRVRAVIDNSGSHAPASSPESRVAAELQTTAGKGNVVRMKFSGLQHHKVLIAKKGNVAQKVLFGSTNFSFRGLYIQANNAVVLYAPEAADYFSKVFEAAFAGGKNFNANPLALQWHLVNVASKPPVHLCFSPHQDAGLSLNPIAAAIDQATSSVFFDIAFLNQMTSGPTHDSINRLEDKGVFSYGICNTATGLQVHKPDGSVGIVSFSYLAKKAPYPFAAEWSGMAAASKSQKGSKPAPGINQHNKFVVTDFNLPTAKVFTGSCNMSVSGEEKNGDNLVMIEDCEVATSYAIEAVRIFDHLEFRARMKSQIEGKTNSQALKAITLQKPQAISGKAPWFQRFYKKDSQLQKDRLLFGH